LGAVLRGTPRNAYQLVPAYRCPNPTGQEGTGFGRIAELGAHGWQWPDEAQQTSAADYLSFEIRSIGPTNAPLRHWTALAGRSSRTKRRTVPYSRSSKTFPRLGIHGLKHRAASLAMIETGLPPVCHRQYGILCPVRRTRLLCQRGRSGRNVREADWVPISNASSDCRAPREWLLGGRDEGIFMVVSKSDTIASDIDLCSTLLGRGAA
jgi:hypothetical protein